MYAPLGGACVCGVAEYPATKTFFRCRGVQHLWHTARNEAIAKGGKGVQTWTPVPASVILKVFLAPLVAALFVLLVLSGNVFAARKKPSDCKPKLHPLETHQLYSKD